VTDNYARLKPEVGIQISLILVFQSLSLNIILPVLHTHHLHVARTRGINWQSFFGNLLALDSKELSLSL